MAMSWMVLGLLGLLFAACWAAGLWIGGRSKPVVLASATMACGLLALRAFFRFRPELEYPLLSLGPYCAIRSWWAFPIVFILLGIGARRMGRRPVRVAVEITAVAVFAFALEPAWNRATFDPSELWGKPGRDGVCMQTQAFTCGAASAATLLTCLGIRTDEKEMTRLCGSTPMTGADEIAVCRALRTKLQDYGSYSVAIERPSADRLERHLRPVMARMRSDVFRDHWVVLFAINDRFAVLGDPAQGKMRIPAGDFYAFWRGTIVEVNRAFGGPYAAR